MKLTGRHKDYPCRFIFVRIVEAVLWHFIM